MARTYQPCRECGGFHKNPRSSSLCEECGNRTTEAPFQKGESVRLVKGKVEQKVLEVAYSNKRWLIRASYLTFEDFTKYPPRWRDASDYVRFETATEESTETVNMSKLFQINNGDNEPKFGTYLATNSVGHLVLEIKGTGEVRAFPPEEVSEVKPYTVALKFVGIASQARSQSQTHYRSKPGALERGDMVIFVDGAIAIVTKIDTKSEAAQSLGKGVRKLVTAPLEPVAGGEAEGEAETEELS